VGPPKAPQGFPLLSGLDFALHNFVYGFHTNPVRQEYTFENKLSINIL
jgi:hypothetical protein